MTKPGQTGYFAIIVTLQSGRQSNQHKITRAFSPGHCRFVLTDILKIFDLGRLMESE
jgi:hypothetical protein